LIRLVELAVGSSMGGGPDHVVTLELPGFTLQWMTQRGNVVAMLPWATYQF
jgi:hypothetical protein